MVFSEYTKKRILFFHRKGYKALKIATKLLDSFARQLLHRATGRRLAEQRVWRSLARRLNCTGPRVALSVASKIRKQREWLNFNCSGAHVVYGMERNETDEKEINGTERETKRNGPFLSITMRNPFSIRSLPVFYNKTVRSVL